jgi:lysophospholipase L1-like esterase
MEYDANQTPAVALRLSQVTTPDRVTIVCVGDSLTGYNNFDDDWPLPTYPDFFQQLLAGRGQTEVVVNGGQAGAFSSVARGWSQQYLESFPRAQRFVIAFGTNDLAQVMEADIEAASARIIHNLAEAMELVRAQGKQVLCFNVPQLNSDCFGRATATLSRRLRAYHNTRLAEFCTAQGIPLADVCAKLENEHFADCLHPNETGARLIAEAVCALIK